MSTDAQPADSSPAPSTFDLGTLNAEQRTEWRMSGKLPEPASDETPDPSSPADSTPAEPVAQVASTDASSEPASEPAPPKKSKADQRFQELLKERATERERADRLERELAALRQAKPDVPASSPAPVEQFPGYDAWAQTHPEGAYDEYLLEKFEHTQTLKQTAAQQKAAQEQFSRTAAERVEAFSQRYREAVSADETLPTRINARLYDLKTVDACLQAGEPVTAGNAIAQEIVESENPVKLLLHLSEHPDEFTRISQLSPAGVIRAMARLEKELDTPAIPPPKTISSAPALTTTLGSRPAVPGDPLKAAEKSGDYSKWRELANAREIAAMGK